MQKYSPWLRLEVSVGDFGCLIHRVKSAIAEVDDDDTDRRVESDFIQNTRTLHFELTPYMKM